MTPMQDRGRLMRAAASLSRTASIFIASAALIAAPALPRPAYAGDIPTFAVDAAWPKPLPNNWIIGQVGGITADSKGHIWIFHRPRSLTDDENIGHAIARLRGTKIAPVFTQALSGQLMLSPATNLLTGFA
jgi:hypothetical protein